MDKYHPTAMFELLYGAIVRNTVYQRLLYEQGQLGRPLTEEEINNIWNLEPVNIAEEYSTAEEHVSGIYSDDGKIPE